LSSSSRPYAPQRIGPGKRLRAFPPAKPGQRIGLFGGSFDPAHAGHAHVAETAARVLALDAVWWLPTADHPFKPNQSPLAARSLSALSLARGRGMVVSHAEATLGTSRTLDLVRAAKAVRPGVKFVWIMGADGLAELHRWRHWQTLLSEVAVCVVARPGSTLAPLRAPAARWGRRHRVRLAEAFGGGLWVKGPPAWVYVPAPLVPLASRDLRRAGFWPPFLAKAA
jgi:nicotinate-nucleotide adenylyltransferase